MRKWHNIRSVEAKKKRKGRNSINQGKKRKKNKPKEFEKKRK